jgi:glycosyltransferase involved in cell wall biosynthesis
VLTALEKKLCREGDILSCLPGWLKTMGGYPEYRGGKPWEYLCNYDQFMSTDWDVILVTRVETQGMFKELRKIHPKGERIKFIGVTGNDNTKFEWDIVPNLMASDYPTFVNSPSTLNKIWYSQEIGHHYFDAGFVPIVGNVMLKTVNQFVNCWPSMRGPWHRVYDMSNWEGVCPTCGADQSNAPQEKEPIDPYGIWDGARNRLPDHWLEEYGINCKHGCVEEVNLPEMYVKGAVTVHFKAYDGYGYSMLQSIVCGRPVIVPRGFHKYRTAGKYLIPNLTCFEADWNSDSLAEVIRYVTLTEERANQYAKACYVAARGLFNFELEAYRIKEFLGRLR